MTSIDYRIYLGMLMPVPSANARLQHYSPYKSHAFEFWTVTRLHTLPPERPLFLQLSLSAYPVIDAMNHRQTVLLWL
jgi:hypothetical protein